MDFRDRNYKKHCSSIYVIVAKKDFPNLNCDDQTKYVQEILVIKKHPYPFEEKVIFIPSSCMLDEIKSEIPKKIQEKKAEDDNAKTEITDISSFTECLQKEKDIAALKKEKKEKTQLHLLK